MNPASVCLHAKHLKKIMHSLKSLLEAPLDSFTPDAKHLKLTILCFEKAPDDKNAEGVLNGDDQSSVPHAHRKYSVLKAEKEQRKEASLDAFERKKRKTPHLYKPAERSVKKRKSQPGQGQCALGIYLNSIILYVIILFNNVVFLCSIPGAVFDIWATDGKPGVQANDWTMPLTIHDFNPGSGRR